MKHVGLFLPCFYPNVHRSSFFTANPNSALLSAELWHTLRKRQNTTISGVNVQRVNMVAACAVITFRIVVEDAVICTGFRVGVQERRGTEAERREFQLLLRQTLLHLSSQSLDVPAEKQTVNGPADS